MCDRIYHFKTIGPRSIKSPVELIKWSAGTRARIDQILQINLELFYINSLYQRLITTNIFYRHEQSTKEESSQSTALGEWKIWGIFNLKPCWPVDIKYVLDILGFLLLITRTSFSSDHNLSSSSSLVSFCISFLTKNSCQEPNMIKLARIFLNHHPLHFSWIIIHQEQKKCIPHQLPPPTSLIHKGGIKDENYSCFACRQLTILGDYFDILSIFVRVDVVGVYWHWVGNDTVVSYHHINLHSTLVTRRHSTPLQHSTHHYTLPPTVPGLIFGSDPRTGEWEIICIAGVSECRPGGCSA